MCDDVWAEQLVSGAFGLRDGELDVINELLPRVPWSWDSWHASARRAGLFKLCNCRARLAPDIGIIPLILALSGCISTVGNVVTELYSVLVRSCLNNV